jgi:predicted TIM-barrel fold metal-dependent hydrolase
LKGTTSKDALIDVNVYLGHCPFRRLPADETSELVSRLRAQNVEQAWAGSFEALLHRDVAGVNLRLAEECRRHGEGLLLPLGTVNPTLPDWQDDVRRCHEVHKMPGIRLHPNYHGYKLDDAVFGKLLDLAAERNLVVQIVRSMEDERTQHPLVQVPHVEMGPLVDHARRLPKLRIVVLNGFRGIRPETVDKLAAAGNVWFDIAMLEGVGGVSKLVGQISADKIVFGSFAPFFYFESAQLKLQESPLGGVERQAIGAGNARKIFKAG